jgi:hypothetical protein
MGSLDCERHTRGDLVKMREDRVVSYYHAKVWKNKRGTTSHMGQKKKWIVEILKLAKATKVKEK